MYMDLGNGESILLPVKSRGIDLDVKNSWKYFGAEMEKDEARMMYAGNKVVEG
jgi:hypothetical protein